MYVRSPPHHHHQFLLPCMPLSTKVRDNKSSHIATMTELSQSLSLPHLDGYFERIELPSRFRREQNPKLDRELLATIQAYHVSHIPYDNTALHYSPTPSISLHIHDIFHKLVTRKRGGYCMENNILLYHILRQLGFDVYLTGARLFRDANIPKPGWSGW